jgi:CelD/BcsL family acetyltransferase involved in cellulose biosynthesis
VHIEVVNESNGFYALRDQWDAVYDADRDAHFFLSWQWMADWLQVCSTAWFVLVARQDEADGPYVAFLPMRMRTAFDATRGFYNELHFAGDAFSDYTGILAAPGFEAEAMAAFAAYLRRQRHWATLTMHNLTMSEPRRRLFLAGFDGARFEQTPIQYLDDGTDHGICPCVALPGDWEDYLDSLSANNRQKIRRLLRRLESSEHCRITPADAGTFDRDIKTLLDFWRIKWGPSKGQHTEEIIRRNYEMLTRCAANGTLFLPVFWHDDRPIAALAILTDDRKRSQLFLITGRDETYDEMPAGYLLHAYSIRRAIGLGYTAYDFLRGNEPYKYLFGPQERRLRAVCVTTRTKCNLGDKLDPQGLPAMLEMAQEFVSKGETAKADMGYRQILQLAPDHGLALLRFGHLLAGQGAHAEAKDMLVRCTEVEPEAENAWLLLARSLSFLGEDQAALAACRQALRIRPDHADAQAMVLKLSLPAPAPRASDAVRRIGLPGARLAPAAIDPARILEQLSRVG